MNLSDARMMMEVAEKCSSEGECAKARLEIMSGHC